MIYPAGQRFYDDLGISEGGSNQGDSIYGCRFGCPAAIRSLPPGTTPTARRAALREVLAHADECSRVAKWEAERNPNSVTRSPDSGPSAVELVGGGDGTPARFRPVYGEMAATDGEESAA